MSFSITGAFWSFERKYCLWHQGQNDESTNLVIYIWSLDGRCMEGRKEIE